MAPHGPLGLFDGGHGPLGPPCADVLALGAINYVNHIYKYNKFHCKVWQMAFSRNLNQWYYNTGHAPMTSQRQDTFSEADSILTAILKQVLRCNCSVRRCALQSIAACPPFSRRRQGGVSHPYREEAGARHHRRLFLSTNFELSVLSNKLERLVAGRRLRDYWTSRWSTTAAAVRFSTSTFNWNSCLASIVWHPTGAGRPLWFRCAGPPEPISSIRHGRPWDSASASASYFRHPRHVQCVGGFNRICSVEHSMYGAGLIKSSIVRLTWCGVGLSQESVPQLSIVYTADLI